MPTLFQKCLIAIAKGQHQKYHEMNEDNPILAEQIRQYWEDLGKTFLGTDVYWSAVFVSWCVKRASEDAAVAPVGFVFARRHSQFCFRAIKNAQDGTGFFWGRRIEQYAPKVGDIIQNNQPGEHFDFDYAAAHEKYASHSAIVVEASDSEIATIGGNEHNSIGKVTIQLDSHGRIKQRNSQSFISIVECAL